jgi:hypothetical protein
VIRIDVPTSPASSTLMAMAGTSAMNGAARNVLTHIASASTRKPGSPRTKRNPSTIDAMIFPSRASAAGAGNVRVRRTATTARKLSAFAPSAHAYPPIAITMPAMAGPTTRPRLYCADESAIAPARSSTGTRSGNSAWNAGKPSAAAMPFPSAMNVRVTGDGLPTTNNTVSSVASAVWKRFVEISSHFRGKRSASAPPSGLKNAIGTNAAAATVPVQAACPVVFWT